MHNWEGMDEAVAVAETGSFVGGAARLNVSTSHISRVIARLEERLGTRLFHRTTRVVSLTATGRSFVEQSQRIIQDRDELFAYAGGSVEPRGELKVSCSVTLGERFVAPIIMRYMEAYPHVFVELNLDNRIVDVVGEGYDLALRTGHISDLRLSGEQIASRPLEVCAAPSYLAQHGEPATPADLARHRCLGGTTKTWSFLDGDTPRPYTPSTNWRCNNGNVIVEAALRGLGICQLPSFYVNEHIMAGTLRPVLSQFRSPPEPIWAAYPQKNGLQTKVKRLIEALQASMPKGLKTVASH